MECARCGATDQHHELCKDEMGNTRWPNVSDRDMRQIIGASDNHAVNYAFQQVGAALTDVDEALGQVYTSYGFTRSSDAEPGVTM